MSILLTVSLPLSAQADAHRYSDRPSILEVEPKYRHLENVPGWRAAQYAYMFFLAETLIFFPDAEYFYLARDAEYAFDVAKVLLKDQPEISGRIHNIPLSGKVAGSPQTRHYLEQEGLNKANLGSRPALFLDSCCFASIPHNMVQLFKGASFPVLGFVIQNPDFPASKLTEALGADGHSIESHPHYTETARELVWDSKANRYDVLAKQHPSESVAALQMMESVRWYFDHPERRAQFAEILGHMQKIFQYGMTDGQVLIEDAVYSYRILRDHYFVPIEHYLTDIELLARMGYAKPNFSAIQNLKAKASRSPKLAFESVQAHAQRIVSLFQWDISQDSWHQLTTDVQKEVADILISRLANNSPAQLLMDEHDHRIVLSRWLERVEDKFVLRGKPTLYANYLRLKERIGETIPEFILNDCELQLL